jgi:hypothetical protein
MGCFGDRSRVATFGLRSLGRAKRGHRLKSRATEVSDNLHRRQLLYFLMPDLVRPLGVRSAETCSLTSRRETLI